MPKANLTPEEREAKAQARRERIAAAEREAKRKVFAKAQVDHFDERTAVSQRGIEIVSLGHGKVRAVIPHFTNCFKRKDDRTEARQLTWASFDTLQSQIAEGGIKPQKYERGVDCGGGQSDGTPEWWKLDAIEADKHLRAFLGEYPHRLMRQIIFEGHRYTDVAATMGIGYDVIAAMFKVTLDQAAIWYGYAKPAATAPTEPLPLPS